jgi:penicillin-binding protein 1B
LLCIVWIGYDDYSDLKLEGSKTAAPIWAQFMKRAVALPQYKDGVQSFNPPAGVVDVKLDKVTNYLATPVCPNDYEAAFISGTEPNQNCEMTAGDQRNFFQKIFGVGPHPTAPPPVSNPTQQAAQPLSSPPVVQSSQAPQSNEDDKKKKGFFGKLFGAIKGDNKDQNSPPSSPSPPAPR